MSQSYYFESYPPLFRPPPNIPQIQESNSDETESLLLDSHIPVIDYFKCTAPTIRTTKYQDVNEDRNLISEACRDWGLFRLVNHGIPITLLNQIEEHAKKLFSLPYETKKAFFANSTSSSSSNFVSPISYFWGSPALSPSGAALAPKKGAQESLQWMEGFNVSLAQLSNIHYQDLLLETFRFSSSASCFLFG
ncbi:hypothetical protein KY289_029579 [Solanum tuberosum]|nr:hypothetical protein KY289_029579 [Solanum tuberosum]